jgi:GNAT superfamily N-acetyltransferase
VSGASSIRPYLPTDREACLEILRSNVPEYFLASDVAEFAAFLDAGPGPYVVVEEEGRVAACGGWFREDEETAGLSWGMVHRARHRMGLGWRLLTYRLERIAGDAAVRLVKLQTIPEVAGFFARAGFEVVSVEPGAYGGVFDRIRMRKGLPSP